MAYLALPEDAGCAAESRLVPLWLQHRCHSSAEAARCQDCAYQSMTDLAIICCSHAKRHSQSDEEPYLRMVPDKGLSK